MTGSDAIDLAFGKDRAKDRREWLASHYIASQYIDPTLEKVTYSDFINKELIQYRYDICVIFYVYLPY